MKPVVMFLAVAAGGICLAVSACGPPPPADRTQRPAPAAAEQTPPTPAAPGSPGAIGSTALPPCCKK